MEKIFSVFWILNILLRGLITVYKIRPRKIGHIFAKKIGS